MARLPEPDGSGFSDVSFTSAIGSAVYFLLDNNPNLKPGDSFYFRSSAFFTSFDGEYVVAGTALDGVSYKLTTTCIGTADVIGQ